MTDNRTTELRKLLDERGVEWRESEDYGTGCVFIWWNSPILGEVHATENEDGTLFMACLNNCDFTPEQAIVATLGSRTLTAKQVENTIRDCSTYASYDGSQYYANGIDMQAIADELNELGSGTKPCYAADENYKRCKYSVNRGWRDNAPFLVWDDTGHLFITMGGLKTWDVTDDAKEWFAELGSGTCENLEKRNASLWFVCSGCGAQAGNGTYSEEWMHQDHTDEECAEYDGEPFNFCPSCGARIRKAVER